MSKIDEVSEAIGELRSDVKSICRELKRGNSEINTRLDKIEEHLRIQNSRIRKLESFKDRIVGIAVAVSFIISMVFKVLFK